MQRPPRVFWTLRETAPLQSLVLPCWRSGLGAGRQGEGCPAASCSPQFAGAHLALSFSVDHTPPNHLAPVQPPFFFRHCFLTPSPLFFDPSPVLLALIPFSPEPCPPNLPPDPGDKKPVNFFQTFPAFLETFLAFSGPAPPQLSSIVGFRVARRLVGFASVSFVQGHRWSCGLRARTFWSHPMRC